MEDKVKEQILAVRDTGLTNMFDTRTVQRIAHDMDFFELVRVPIGGIEQSRIYSGLQPIGNVKNLIKA